MDFIVEPKAGYDLTIVSNKLHAMNIAHVIVDTEDGNHVIKAELSFDEVCNLKDMAYCTHEEHHES